MLQHLQEVNGMAQWLNLAMNGVSLLLFVTGLVLAWWYARRQRLGAAEEELARIARARSILQGLLKGSVAALVTQAEQEYGPKTGAIKKSAVLAEMVKLLPEDLRTQFDVETLDAIVESGLTAAKAVWAKQRDS